MSAFQPTLDTLDSGDRQLTATWTNHPDVGINNAFLFVLNKSTNEMTKLNLNIAEAESQTYVIADPSLALVNGVTYLVQYVQQQDSDTGDSYGSNTLAGVPSGVPNTPILSLLDEGSGTALVNVSYRGNNGAAYTYVEFKICDISNNEMQLDQSFNFPAQKPVPASFSDASYTLTNLTNGIPYSIACYVYNQNGSCAQISNTVTINPTDQPNPPADLQALSGEDGQVTVTFENSAQPTGVSVAAWEVYKSLATVSSFSLLTTLPYVADFSYVVTDLAVSNGVGYQYKVRAISTDDVAGAYSTPVTALPFKPVEIGSFLTVPGDSEIACAWTLDSIGATFVSPPSIVYYDLEVGTGTTVVDGVEVPNFDNEATFYDLSYTPLAKIVSGLTNGTAYNLRIRAKSIIPSSLRNLVDAPTNVVDKLPFAAGAWVARIDVTPATTPGAPTDLAALVDSHVAQLTWIAPANNGGSPVLRYTVYQYATELDASLNVNATLVETVVPPVENVTIMDLVNGTSYWYRITASNMIGEGPLSDILGPVIPFDNVDPPIFVDAVQLDASSTYVDVSLNWTSPLPVAGINIVRFDVYDVDVNGNKSLIDTVGFGDYDSSNNDGTFNYSIYINIPNPTVPGLTFAIQTVADNPNYPPQTEPYIFSTYAFEYLLIAIPPTIVSGPVVSWDPLTERSTYRFEINTHDVPLLAAILYAPPSSDVPPIPNPITIGAVGSIVNGYYTFTLDYQVPTASASLAYFVMFATAGGSTNKQAGI